MSRSHHGGAAVPGGHGLVADGGRSRRDARSPAPRRRRFRARSPKARFRCAWTNLRRRWSEKIRAAADREDEERARGCGSGAAAARREAGPAPPPVDGKRRRAARASGDGLVLVGTSTGGPPALEALLVPLPRAFPWPILVAQHMPATFTGPLARRLDELCAPCASSRCCARRSCEAGCVYIGRGDADIIVAPARRGAGRDERARRRPTIRGIRARIGS